MKKIAIIGATGMLGKPVTREIYKAGFDVTLLARDITKTRKIFPTANIIQADVLDKDSLVKAFTGQDEIYINLQSPVNAKPSHKLPEREGIDNIVSAAKSAGIQRLA